MNNETLERAVRTYMLFTKTSALIDELAKHEMKNGVTFTPENLVYAMEQTGTLLFGRPDIEYRKEIITNTELRDLWEQIEMLAKEKKIEEAKQVHNKRMKIVNAIRAKYKGLIFYAAESDIQNLQRRGQFAE